MSKISIIALENSSNSSFVTMGSDKNSDYDVGDFMNPSFDEQVFTLTDISESCSYSGNQQFQMPDMSSLTADLWESTERPKENEQREMKDHISLNYNPGNENKEQEIEKILKGMKQDLLNITEIFGPDINSSDAYCSRENSISTGEGEETINQTFSESNPERIEDILLSEQQKSVDSNTAISNRDVYFTNDIYSTSLSETDETEMSKFFSKENASSSDLLWLSSLFNAAPRPESINYSSQNVLNHLLKPNTVNKNKVSNGTIFDQTTLDSCAKSKEESAQNKNSQESINQRSQSTYESIVSLLDLLGEELLDEMNNLINNLKASNNISKYEDIHHSSPVEIERNIASNSNLRSEGQTNLVKGIEKRVLRDSASGSNTQNKAGLSTFESNDRNCKTPDRIGNLLKYLSRSNTDVSILSAQGDNNNRLSANRPSLDKDLRTSFQRRDENIYDVAAMADILTKFGEELLNESGNFNRDLENFNYSPESSCNLNDAYSSSYYKVSSFNHEFQRPANAENELFKTYQGIPSRSILNLASENSKTHYCPENQNSYTCNQTGYSMPSESNRKNQNGLQSLNKLVDSQCSLLSNATRDIASFHVSNADSVRCSTQNDNDRKKSSEQSQLRLLKRDRFDDGLVQEEHKNGQSVNHFESIMEGMLHHKEYGTKIPKTNRRNENKQNGTERLLQSFGPGLPNSTNLRNDRLTSNQASNAEIKQASQNEPIQDIPLISETDIQNNLSTMSSLLIQLGQELSQLFTDVTNFVRYLQSVDVRSAPDTLPSDTIEYSSQRSNNEPETGIFRFLGGIFDFANTVLNASNRNYASHTDIDLDSKDNFVKESLSPVPSWMKMNGTTGKCETSEGNRKRTQSLLFAQRESELNIPQNIPQDNRETEPRRLIENLQEELLNEANILNDLANVWRYLVEDVVRNPDIGNDLIENIQSSPANTMFNILSGLNRRGVPRNRIERLPTVLYKHINPDDIYNHSHCHVCLCAFKKDSVIRKLPCSHAFHKDCIDTWFRYKGTCPLCLAEV